MKIGINATFLHDKPTGLGVFTREVSRALWNANREVLLFSPLGVEGIPEDAFYKVPYGVRGSLRFRHNLFRAFYINSLLPLHCVRKQLDILYCPMLEYPFVPLVPLVVHIHDLHPIKFDLQFKRAATHFRISLKWAEKAVRRITVVSEFVKQELLAATDIPGDRIDVVLNGYNSQAFYPHSPEGKEEFLRRQGLGKGYILFVGNLFPYKNVDVLIEAFLRIKRRVGQSLVIIGRKEFAVGPLRQDERILYMDYVPFEDIPKFYSYAEMLVHPSLAEGFGLTPLEAMACGTPVLSSRSGALPEVVGDAGILFDPQDAAGLSELIAKTLDDEGVRAELRAKGLKRAALFSWDKTASGILRSCERALNGKG